MNINISKLICYQDGKFMGRTSKKKDNELIRKRRKRKTIKRTIITLVVLASIVVALCLKLPYFNITNIVVKNNKTVSSDLIISLSGLKTGKNIFNLNSKTIKNRIMTDKYINNVTLSRKLPSTLIVTVEERQAVYYILSGSKYVIADSNGIVLEVKDFANTAKLIKLKGFNGKKAVVGETIEGYDSRKIDALKVVSTLSLNLDSTMPKIVELNLNETLNIQLICGKMTLKLGSPEDISNKLNKAINILKDKRFTNAKGYIDVSFNNNPVVFVQN